ncbi:MAG: cobyrinate a,c-diamide synthase [Lachnospiraceae bacterium]|nr:cobyrinate a,c-diamide synthase [Lachnospiraceae bacterium]
MRLPRIMIAAPKSGSGKTMITCALLELLKEQGNVVSAFKCGPDFIDPMFHREIIGVPSRNLDCFFSDDEQVKGLFLQRDLSGGLQGQQEDREGCETGERKGTANREKCEIAYREDHRTANGEDSDKKNGISVIEGVMGLYDGLGGIEETASSYHLARVLKAPILLVIDARGMGRSLLPLIKGFLAYDREHLIKGVILNKVGPAFSNRIAPVIRHELKVPVVGCFPEQREALIESRHLGLMLPAEVDALKARVRETAGILAQNVDMDQIMAIADQAPELSLSAETKSSDLGVAAVMGVAVEEQGRPNVRIAVARDEAFCFYYEDNLRLLQENGAELVEFSPLHDRALPENVDGILLGGGYPELYADRLAENKSMRASIKHAIEKGMPSVAECGGFLYLHEAMIDQNGEQFPMCGVLPEICEYKGRLVRFGYITLDTDSAGERAVEDGFLAKGETIRAHEFHYYDSSDNGNAYHAVKPVSGQEWDCVHAGAEHWWGFPHLYYPSNPTFADNYIVAVNTYKNCQQEKSMR